MSPNNSSKFQDAHVPQGTVLEVRETFQSWHYSFGHFSAYAVKREKSMSLKVDTIIASIPIAISGITLPLNP